jgi:glycosyltransferase involved in cell wall biosynthesis
MQVSIVIPAYNEGLRLGRTLDQYLAFYADIDMEFIIVPNNCTDNTAKIARDYSSRFPDKVRVVEIPGYSGKGGAVLAGFRISRGDYIGFVDADGSTSPAEFSKLLGGIKSHDGVIASRWKSTSKIVNPNIFREFVSIGFMALVKVMFWMPFIDTQCGAKLFTRKSLFSILDTLQIKDMSFDVEILWRLKKSGFDIKEIPTVWVDDSGGSVALGSVFRLMKNSWQMFRSVLKIRFSKNYA